MFEKESDLHVLLGDTFYFHAIETRDKPLIDFRVKIRKKISSDFHQSKLLMMIFLVVLLCWPENPSKGNNNRVASRHVINFDHLSESSIEYPVLLSSSSH